MKFLKIAAVTVAILFVMALIYPAMQERCSVDSTRNMLSQLRVAVNIYVTEYGTPPPLAPSQLLAVLQGKSLDGDNPREIVFIDLSRKQFDGNGEMLDRWDQPFVWETHPPQGKLAVWSRGEKQKLTREEAMEQGYYQVLIE